MFKDLIEKETKKLAPKGLSVIVRNEKEYNKIVDFIGKENGYIDWQPQMSETETAIIIWSKHKDYSIGSVGSAEFQRKNRIKTKEFSDFFKI